MDEGRLGVVVRQEEQHRKFVHIMNDMVRTRLGVYSNFLDREQHDSTTKHVKNCVTIRRSIVRQSVLKKCLEARKRKTLARDPDTHFGQYGGKPLYAMSRDIDRVIADNHPRLRRLRRVELAMRQSLESGAILDDETMARRMNAFFSLQFNRKSSARTRPAQSNGPEAGESEDVFSQSSKQMRRRRDIRRPSVNSRRESSSGKSQPASASLPQSESLVLPAVLPGPTKGTSLLRRPEVLTADGLSPSSTDTKDAPVKTQTTNCSSSENRISLPSLNVDSKGRLRGIVKAEPIDTIHEQEDDTVGEENRDSTTSGAVAGKESKLEEEGLTSQENRKVKGREKKQEGSNIKAPSLQPRSKLILPPIQPSKALVSRT